MGLMLRAINIFCTRIISTSRGMYRFYCIKRQVVSINIKLKNDSRQGWVKPLLELTSREREKCTEGKKHLDTDT